MVEGKQPTCCAQHLGFKSCFWLINSYFYQEVNKSAFQSSTYILQQVLIYETNQAKPSRIQGNHHIQRERKFSSEGFIRLGSLVSLWYALSCCVSAFLQAERKTPTPHPLEYSCVSGVLGARIWSGSQCTLRRKNQRSWQHLQRQHCLGENRQVGWLGWTSQQRTEGGSQTQMRWVTTAFSSWKAF